MKNKTKNQKSQTEFSFEPLIDLKLNGKKRNWNMQKKMSLAVSDAYFKDSDLTRYGEKIKGCGTFLEFDACPVIEHGKVLTSANFCKCRQCVMCQGRKSSLIRKQVLDVTHEHLKRRKTDVPLLLTLTVVNETGETLGQLVDRMAASWGRLMRLASVKGAVRSWFRSLEVTYNSERGDYHPHFHAVLMVPHNYFRKKRGLYITNEKWLQMWQQSMRDDRITQVDIRTIKKKERGELESFVAEAAKYATKPSSYIFETQGGDYEASPEVVRDMHYALKGRRLIAYGGIFSKIRKEKKMVDAETADLVDSDDDSKKCGCKICGSAFLKELYGWGFGLKQYCKIPERSQENEVDVEDAEVVYEAVFPEKENESFRDHNDIEKENLEDSFDIMEESSKIFEADQDGKLPLKLKFKQEKESLILLRGPP